MTDNHSSSNPVSAPDDAAARKSVKPVIVYANDTLSPPDLPLYRAARADAEKIDEVIVPPREA